MVNEIRFFLLSIFDYTDQKDSLGSRIFSFFISWLISLSIIAMIATTVPSMKPYTEYFIYFEYFALTVFSIEYFLRLWISPLLPYSKGIFQHMMQPLMLLDLIVLLPFWVAICYPESMPVGFLMVMRVFRVLRQKYYFTSAKQLLKILIRHKTEIWGSLLLGFFVILLISTVMYYLEHDAQPEKFSSIPMSMYWGVVTFATLGYGDVTPITIMGKLFTSVVTFFSIILYSLPASIVGAALYAEVRSAQAKEIEQLHRHINDLENEKRIQKLIEKERQSLQSIA